MSSCQKQLVDDNTKAHKLLYNRVAIDLGTTVPTQLNLPMDQRLKGGCEYWEDHLKELSDGRLVAPDGWSPENLT